MPSGPVTFWTIKSTKRLIVTGIPEKKKPRESGANNRDEECLSI